jgi:prepilin-type processing-associated H-X9-DG protein
MLLLGGGAGLPLGVPPLPEDPLLARVAPEECLFYASFAGTAAPDAKSANQTEQLLAEPEVQRALAEIERAIVAKIGRTAPPDQAAMSRDAVRWGKKLLTRPVTAFVSSVRLGPQGPDIRGGLVINVGEDAAELKAALEGYQALLPGGAEKVDVAGTACYRFRIEQAGPAVTWGMKGKYLLAGVGEGSLEGILQRAGGSAPAWLAAVRKQLPVERPSTLMYLNVKKIVDQFAPLGGPKALIAIAATGLGNVTSLSAVTGLDGEGIVSRIFAAVEGEPAGVLGIVAGKPLEARDLVSIPRDANLAVAARLDAARVLETALGIAGKIEPGAPAEFEAGLAQVASQLGVDLRKDVLAALGDLWCVYNSSDEGGLIMSGLTAVVQVKDHQRLSAAHAKLLAAVKAALDRGNPPPGKKPERPKKPGELASMEEYMKEVQEEQAYTRQFLRPRPRIVQLPFAGQDIYFLSAGNDLPFAPAWCLTPKELIVAAFPQQIKAYLSRGADFKSLAAAPAAAQCLGPGEARPGEAPIALGYFDARKLLDYLYPMACMGLQIASREFARAGIDLDVSIVPSAPAIYRHLRPGTTVLRRTAGGIELISRGTVPGASLGTAAPIAVGLLLPAVQAARQSARRAVSMNNLKQISLAMIMYESANRHLPPAYIADKKTGKPLLSWRVAILPYLDQQALYQSFHLDEPWDSEHNKKLAETVVRIYRSPASRAAPTMTNYLTVRGKDTAFPGKDPIRFADIIDGSSNTIMVVEASDGKAVPWTKPDDFEYDEKQPAAGLLGLWPGGFNAAFCDGSVRFLSATIDAEMLRRLFNRNDGKPVDTSRF